MLVGAGQALIIIGIFLAGVLGISVSIFGAPAKLAEAGDIIRQSAVVIGLFFSGAGASLVRRGRRLIALSADDLLRDDGRAPVLLLRTFADDELVVQTTGQQNFFPIKLTLEEALVSPLSKVGPVVAIGRPGERVAPLGAGRKYLSDERWRNAIESWLEQANLVAMAMGPISEKEGLAWELGQVMALNRLAKLILVMPHGSVTADSRERWNQYNLALGNILPPYRGDELFVAFDSA